MDRSLPNRLACATIGCAIFFNVTVFAETAAERAAQREMAKREAALPRGNEALVRAKAAIAGKDYRVAFEEYRTAVAYLPDAVVSGSAHDEAVGGFCKAGLKLAEAEIAAGRYNQAEAICREILSNRYDPNCRAAQELLAHLETPGWFNRTMGPKFIVKVEEVKRLLTEAEGFYNSGRYDLAMKRYEQVLNLDPYNVAARRGEERIDNTKFHYGEEAYNETRSRSMWQVEHGWEEPVRNYGRSVADVALPSTPLNLSGTAGINNKLNSIIIPRVEFRDASIREAVDFLREQAAANDQTGDTKRGVDIVLRLHALGGRVPTETVTTTAVPSPAPSLPQGNAPPPATAESPVAVVAGPSPAIAVPAAPAVAPGQPRITLTLNEIPVGEALRYVAAQANLKVKAEPHAVLLIPLSEQSQELVTKRYRVPPEFFGGPLDVGFYQGTGEAGGAAAATSNGSGQQSSGTEFDAPVSTNAVERSAYNFQRSSTVGVGNAASTNTQSQEGTQSIRQRLANDRQLVGRADAKTMLQSMGVEFPPGASAIFLPQTAALIVRNTQDNIDFIDALVDQASLSIAKQVEIESKFVEVNQNNLKELGFDWLLGQFNIGNHRVFGGGGTTGQPSGPGVPPGSPDFPFASPNGVPVGQFPVTAANRSGSLAITASALDALLGGTSGLSGVAPGIFGLAGVFTDPQFQLVIRALNQKKAIDLLSAPKVTTKSGQRAIIEVVREFRYPTDYTPPQIPNIGSGTTTTSLVANPVVPVVVTPTTPTKFGRRNTGVTLEVEPVVGSDGTTIDLNLVPQVTEFEGFINYGSPINAVGVNTVAGFSVSTPVRLTDNVINQPIFSTRKVTTSVSVWDGATVVLGGLMREDVQKTEDRTPIIGDIPLVGRLFRSSAEQHIKRNLIIFVTARLVNPGGAPVNAAEEIEEQDLVEPPVLPEVPAYKK